MKLPKLNSKDVITVISAIGFGVLGAMGKLSESKREQEFQDMKRIVSELQSKNGES